MRRFDHFTNNILPRYQKNQEIYLNETYLAKQVSMGHVE